MDVLSDVFVQMGALGGVAAFIGLLINVLKSCGAIPDGQAQNVSAALNLVGVSLLLGLRIFKPEFDVAGVDAQAAAFAQVAEVVFAYVLSLGGSKLTHNIVKGILVVGKSNTVA
jgi:hypothetical protein